MSSIPADKYQSVLDAFHSVPEHMVAEILDGELFTQARPRGLHAVAHSVLGMDIGSAFQRGRGGPGGWFIIDEPELHLKRDICVPDLAGWRRERMPTIPEGVEFTIVPDWVCEVLSPSTELRDRTRKLRIYAREGVKHLWFVSPRLRTIEAYRLVDAHWMLIDTYEGDSAVRIEPFDAIELEITALWEGAPPATLSET